MKFSFALSLLTLSLFLFSCDSNPFKSNERTKRGEEFYDQFGIPPEVVDHLRSEELLELIALIESRDTRVLDNPEVFKDADLYRDFGLPKEIADRMVPHQIIEFIQLREDWLSSEGEIPALDFYRDFGLPTELTQRMQAHQILEFMQLRIQWMENLPSDLSAIPELDLYKDFGLPAEVAQRMEAHELIEYLHQAAEVANNRRSEDEVSEWSSLYEEYGLPKEVADRMEPHEIMEFINMKNNPELSHEMNAFIPSPAMIMSTIGIFSFMVILLVGLGLYYNYRKSVNLHDLMYHSIKEGKEIPFEMLQMNSRRSDFRRGIVLISIGLALIMFFNFSNGPIVVGFIPFLIGLGYMVIGRFVQK